MKINILKLAAVGLLIWSLGAQAGTIYKINRTVGSGTISGTIETNGTIGSLTTSDILSWSFDAYDGTDNISISSASGGFLQGNAWSYFSATPSRLLFDFHGAFADPAAELISFHGQDNPQTYSFDYNLLGNFLGRLEQLVHQFGTTGEHRVESSRQGVEVIGTTGDPGAHMPRVVHSVHVGGPDICSGIGQSPGCDATLSITANEFGDGSVNGRWTDVWAVTPGVDPITIVVAIDCLHVVGNDAWVAGEIVGPDFAGLRVGTRVQDNGVSANDWPDFASFINGFDGDCHDAPDWPLFAFEQGQVSVR
jgi:hypothetical protein